RSLSWYLVDKNSSPLGAALMPDEHEQACRDWRMPDELWERIVPLLPPRKPHPLGCHRPRVDDRQAMDAIFFVLRTGCPWGALDRRGSVPPWVCPPPLPRVDGGGRLRGLMGTRPGGL